MAVTDPPAPPERSRVESRILASLTEVPAHSRGRSLIVVLLIVLVLGWIDYSSGIWFSLQFFYLIPIALSVAWLGWRAGCAIAATCVTVRLVGDIAAGIFNNVEPFAVFWNRFIDLLISFVVVWIFHSLISLQRQLEQRVAQRTADLVEAAKARRELEHELLMVGARERNTFGQELHDDICQHLVGTALAAKVLASRLAERDHAAAVDAQSIVGWIEEGADKTRRLARGLLLSAIAPEELGEKLAQLAGEGQGSGVACHFSQRGEILVSDAGIAAQLFRIAQEAVRNAVRHSGATRVNLSLVGDDRAICLTVEDDGHGLPPADQRGLGIGLRIMSHRAAYIGGTLSLVSDPGGTRVICRLPHASTE